MATPTHITRVQESIFSFIGDAGAVTPKELRAFIGGEAFPAEVWLREQERAGSVHRDEFGRYGTSCAWPRVGF